MDSVEYGFHQRPATADPATFRYNIFNPKVMPELPRKWMDKAACTKADQAIFFPPKGASVGPAKMICATCPVLEECRAYALMTNTKHGIWGGMSERERRRILGARSYWHMCKFCGDAKFGAYKNAWCCNNYIRGVEEFG